MPDVFAVRPDVFAVVNCRFVALSVFYSTFLMRSLILYFAVVNCADVALSVFYSPVLTLFRMFLQL